MSTSQDVLDIIQHYLERYKQSQASYSQLLAYTERYIMEHPEREAEMSDLLHNTHRHLIAYLEALEKDNTIVIVRRDGTPLSVVYPAFFISRLNAYYHRNDEHPELPFPNEDTLGLSIPIDLITAVDIKGDFMAWLNRPSGDEKLLRINFPDGIASMICTSELLKTKVLATSVHKIRHYLRDTKNMSYTRQKLTPLLRSRELAVKDMLHSIVTTPESASQSIAEPTDFTFHMWTQLSTNIIKEYGQKADKMTEEHGFCQAAYLIGYYNVFHRGVLQKRKEEELAVNVISQTMKRPPYAFRITEIHEFKDDKGILLTKRLDRDKINNHLRDKLKPAPNKDLPEMLRVKTPEEEEFFVLYASIPALANEQLIRIQKEVREFYKRSWNLSLRQDIEYTTMHDDEEFRKHIEQRLRNHYPLFFSLLSYETIYLSSRLDSVPENYRHELNEMLNPTTQKLKPYEQIFRVNRKKMLEDAKILLPAWMVLPVIRSVVRFMRLLFLGPELANEPYAAIFDHEGQTRIQIAKKSKKGPPQQAPGQSETDDQDESKIKLQNAKKKALEFKNAAKTIEAEFLLSGSSMTTTMANMEERWNTIIDAQTKKNLTEDVNALCRDYLRKMKISSRSKLPTAGDVRAYALKVWETETLLQIRNRKDLLRYLELYILYLLQNMS